MYTDLIIDIIMSNTIIIITRMHVVVMYEIE